MGPTNEAGTPVSPSTRLDDTGLPTRAVNRLKHEGVRAWALCHLRSVRVLRTPGLGHKSLEDLRRLLERAGLRFSGQADETE